MFFFMHHYFIFSAIRSRPENSPLLCCTPASADAAVSSVTHAVVTTSSKSVNDLCAALCSSQRRLSFKKNKKNPLNFTYLHVHWQIFHHSEPSSPCECKSCICRLYFLPGVAGVRMTALHKKTTHGDWCILSTQAYVYIIIKL